MSPQVLVPVSVPWPVPRWCDCVGAPHCWKQGITQCCSTFPVDAPSCVADLVSMESSGIGLPKACISSAPALWPGVKPGQ